MKIAGIGKELKFLHYDRGAGKFVIESEFGRRVDAELVSGNIEVRYFERFGAILADVPGKWTIVTTGLLYQWRYKEVLVIAGLDYFIEALREESIYCQERREEHCHAMNVVR
jgi:hypothetical protein